MTYFVLLYSAIGIVRLENFPVVTLLNYLWPTFTLLFALFFVQQPYNKNLLAGGVIIVTSGLAVEILGSNLFARTAAFSWDAAPYSFAFLGAVSWGLYSALNRHWGDSAGGVRALPLLMLSTSVALLVLRVCFAEESNFTPGVLPALIYLSVMPYAANLCWDLGTRGGDLPLLSLLADFVPWASLTITAVYLQVEIGATTWTSAVLIVLGALLSRLALRVPAEAD